MSTIDDMIACAFHQLQHDSGPDEEAHRHAEKIMRAEFAKALKKHTADRIAKLERQNAELRQQLLDPKTVHASMLAGQIAKISMEQCAHTHGAEALAKYQQLAVSADKTAATVQPDGYMLFDRNGEAFGHSPKSCPMRGLDWEPVYRAAPQPQAAQSEDSRDAARYRQVRRGQKWSVINGIGEVLRADALDSAIDAALAQAGKGKALTQCAAHQDGECCHTQCPQLRDGEPKKSGRHCPLDTQEDDRD